MAMSDEEFDRECLRWRGRKLTGVAAHLCWDYDFLPMDETCPEWPCGCAYSETVKTPAKPEPK